MRKGNGFMAGLIFIIGIGSLCAYHNIQKTEYLENAKSNTSVSDKFDDVNNEATYVYQTYCGDYPTDKFISTTSVPKDDEDCSYRFIGVSYSNEITIYEKETKDASGRWNKTNNYVLNAGSDSEYVRYVIKDVITNSNSNSKQKVK